MPSQSKGSHLIRASREAMLAAVQAFNNPLMTFKTETFIVLSMIAWTYLLHVYYRKQQVEYRYCKISPTGRRRFIRNQDRSYKYWDLTKCLEAAECPLDEKTKANLNFLIGLRNHIEHHKPEGLDSYLSARYQACALNFNYYLKKLNGDRHGLDKCLALSLQFAELDYTQAQITKNKEKLIPESIVSYVAGFDSKLAPEIVQDDRYGYRLLFTKVMAKREGQADRVIEFLDPKSELAKSISKEYWVKVETEKPKFTATHIAKKVREAGFADFGIHQHTLMWQKHDAKNPDKGFGIFVANYWYWYQKWADFIISTLSEAPIAVAPGVNQPS